MELILLEEVRGKGGEGDVVTVNDGFANNYLLRHKMAVKATKGNLKQLEERRKNIAKREEVRISNAEDMKTLLEDGVITVKAKVGEEGQLFGSVTAQMIADAIKESKGVEVDRRRIDVRKPIKTVGAHEVEMSLYRDIKATLKLNVVDAEAPDGSDASEVAAAAEAVAEVATAVEAVEVAEAVETAVEAAELAEAAATVEAIEDVVETAAAVEEVAEAAAVEEAAEAIADEN